MNHLIPNLFVSAGAMKAGTTWLYHLLRTHPQIIVTPIKEVHFFARGYTHWDVLSDRDRLDRVRQHIAGDISETNMPAAACDLSWLSRFIKGPVNTEWFANLFEQRSPDNYCADFSNWSALVRGVGWRRMRMTADKLKVLYTIRSPAHRYWSHIKFYLGMFEPGRNVNELSRETIATMLESEDFDQHGRYADFIADARSHLGEDELKVIFFEDYKYKPLDVLRGIESYLGISEIFYDPFDLYKALNKTEHIVPSHAFLDAVQGRVEDELEKLDKLGIAVPLPYRWEDAARSMA